MENTIARCPYCEGRMHLMTDHYLDRHGDWWKAFYFCTSCGSEGPKSYGALTEEQARKRAIERGTDRRPAP